MSLPTTQRALVTRDEKPVVEEIPVKQPEAGEVVVKVISAGVNPTDWKHVTFKLGPEGSVIGCDYSGIVVKVGSGATRLKVGDNVFGVVGGASTYTPELGAFSEYITVPEHIVVKAPATLKYDERTSIPSGPIDSFQGAATIGVVLFSIAEGLEFFSGIPVYEKSAENAGKFAFVWGGASGLGINAIQLLKEQGFTVVTTASKKNWDLLKSLGADHLFDYHDEDVVEQVRALVGDNVVLSVDTITLPESIEPTLKIISQTKPADYISFLPGTKIGAPSNVKEHSVLAYLILTPKKQFGINGTVLESNDKLLKWGESFVVKTSERVQGNPGFVKHSPVKVLPNGLDSLAEALDDYKTGKNSGLKYVVNISKP